MEQKTIGFPQILIPFSALSSLHLVNTDIQPRIQRPDTDDSNSSKIMSDSSDFFQIVSLIYPSSSDCLTPHNLFRIVIIIHTLSLRSIFVNLHQLRSMDFPSTSPPKKSGRFLSIFPLTAKFSQKKQHRMSPKQFPDGRHFLLKFKVCQGTVRQQDSSQATANWGQSWEPWDDDRQSQAWEKYLQILIVMYRKSSIR